ncbi:MAG: hypothetical protein ABI317_12610 [Gaiellales bacterium]
MSSRVVDWASCDVLVAKRARAHSLELCRRREPEVNTQVPVASRRRGPVGVVR